MTSSVSVHTRLSLSLDLRSRPDSLILVQIQFITVKRNSALLSQYSRIKIIQMFPYFTTISNEPSTVLSSLHSHSFEIRGLCWNLNLFFMAVRTLQFHQRFWVLCPKIFGRAGLLARATVFLLVQILTLSPVYMAR